MVSCQCWGEMPREDAPGGGSVRGQAEGAEHDPSPAWASPLLPPTREPSQVRWKAVWQKSKRERSARWLPLRLVQLQLTPTGCFTLPSGVQQKDLDTPQSRGSSPGLSSCPRRRKHLFPHLLLSQLPSSSCKRRSSHSECTRSPAGCCLGVFWGKEWGEETNSGEESALRRRRGTGADEGETRSLTRLKAVVEQSGRAVFIVLCLCSLAAPTRLRRPARGPQLLRLSPLLWRI